MEEMNLLILASFGWIGGWNSKFGQVWEYGRYIPLLLHVAFFVFNFTIIASYNVDKTYWEEMPDDYPKEKSIVTRTN